jgi:CheY-like chemotaxis protein
LPRHLGEADAAVRQPAPAEAAAPASGETILIVDDDPAVRMLITEALGDVGYTMIEVTDGAAGLKVLRSDVRIDLLVTDVGLPGGLNGRQMADAARLGRPDLKVLFITGYAESAAIGKDELEPGMHLMTKPFTMAALAGRVRAVIAGG